MNIIGQSFGRYHILEQLGEGGMATVYRAYDTRLDADVAVKVIRRSAFAPDQLEQVLKRFEREAKSLAKLSHANIVGVIDYGDYEGSPYLVMEYLPGGTLKDKLGQPIPCREAARLLVPIARALDFAHRKGMAHRDVKPSNILITADGDPMLTDFGIAKILEAQEGATLTGTGVGIGTPEYMAPEQWTGQAGPSSDIYSLGVVFYEMLTGRKPYIADTPAAVLLKQASDPLPNPRQLMPDLSEEAEHVLLRALAKRPEDRFASMAEFAAALEGLQGEQTRTMPAAGVIAVAAETLSAAKTSPATSPATGTNMPTAVIDSQKADELKTVVAPLPAGAGKPPPPAKTEKTAGKGGRRGWLWAVSGIVVAGIVIIAVLGLVFLIVNPFKGIAPPIVQATLPPTLAVAVNPAVPTLMQGRATATPAYFPEQCIQPEVFCVGLVTDEGTVFDKSFNQAAWGGVLQAKNQGLVQVAQFIETKDAKDYDRNISSFADGGYDVVVTVGWTLTDATKAAALKYPGVLFIGVDQVPDQSWPANAVGLNFPEDQAGFLVGALAARMSQSGYIAAVCGTDVVPAVARFGNGYRAGAKFADQQTGRNTIVDVVYHPNNDKAFTDPDWGAGTAKAFMDKGADVIFGCGGDTGNGAVITAAQAGRYAIGVDVDQYYTLPEAAPRLLSSAMKDITPSVLNQIKAVRNGTFTGGSVLGTAAYAPYHDLDSQVPPEVKAWMEDVVMGLQAGKIHTNLGSAGSCKSDRLGCITIKPGEPIHIAYALVVSGPNQTLGVDARNGVEIAIDDLGGKIVSHDILFDGVDSGCSTDGGMAAASKLAADPTIVGVIGPSCSSETRAGMSLLSKAGFSVISPSNTAPDLTEPGNPRNYPGFLRTAHNDIVQGAAAAEYAYNVLGLRKAATIQDGSLYADQLQQIFADNFTKLGGKITAQLKVDPNQTDMSAVLAKIAQGKPELIYLPIFQPAGPLIIMQAKNTPGLEKVTLMGADGLFSPDVIQTAGQAANGFMVSSPFISGSAYDAFLKKYQAKYGEQPISIFHAHSYDALMLLKAAIERVALVDSDGTLHIGRQALRDALYATLNYHGITGILSCTPTGDCARAVIGIYEYRDGKYPPALIYPK
jgi:basic membrane lipoprotein Med (substrate-binding protein (PBP1-ABC) superfamily)/tRNA A-37 threonylcarbamoyl transferase component Bud32